VRSAIEAAIALFPQAFGLAGFPGDVFRLSATSSYLGGEDNNTVMLYTERLVGDQWLSFAKGTIAEVRAQVRHLDAYGLYARARAEALAGNVERACCLVEQGNAVKAPAGAEARAALEDAWQAAVDAIDYATTGWATEVQS